MKKTFFLLFTLAAAIATAQKNDHLVTMDGIGAIKIGMSQEELEKLLNKKIPLTNPQDTTSGSWQDSATIKYKNIQLNVDFQRSYKEENSFYMRVIGMRTSSPLCKTRAGIGIGSDKLSIINAYENDLLIMLPDFVGDTNERSRTKYSIIVRDIEKEREIVFYLKNKKVVSMEATTYWNDSE